MVPAVTVMNDVSCCLWSEGRVDEFICLLNTVLACPPTETLLSVGFEDKTNFLSRYTLASCSRAFPVEPKRFSQLQWVVSRFGRGIAALILTLSKLSESAL